jgi:hypothetical protein
MAEIILENLQDLNSTGVILFNDSENFMTEITDNDVPILGGYAATAINKLTDAFCGRFTNDLCSIYSCFLSHPPALMALTKNV